MADTGRPTKLTAEVQKAICDRIKKGTRAEVAAGVEGIGRQTYFDWMSKGREGTAPYAAFRTEVARAEDIWEDEAGQTALGGDGAGTSFGPAKASLEVLGRRRPRQWAQRVKHELDDGLREFTAIAERVCRAKDRPDIFVAICEELSRLDSEADAGEAEVAGSGAVH